ncbi:VWA domain-containing protein [Alphaproteobacteria bacterium KMM 3653]|uniref:VWA domain-containing protein n=1 Tax=Harenicola maris TaxID=2841044 RepID=A0AAP2CPD0_9RHOB|nr:VWA domain-containing protein [Harenicola maris]
MKQGIAAIFLSALPALGALPAASETQQTTCKAIFDQFVQDNPVDLSQCQATEAVYTLDDCPKPDLYNGAPQTTHIILALDASGSMAGRLGTRSKMEIAKSEARAFLGDVHSSSKVSLVVYGHRGDNSEAGKPASCTSAEVLHGFDARRSALKDSITALQPTGWTPLAGVLDFIAEDLAKLPAERAGKPTAPVVYLISDGEETCEGDPVAAATRLANTGIRTTLHTIGFDADAATTAQLEAISKAGGGRYYPAKDAKALRDQLQKIQASQGAAYRYNYCININAARISGAHQKAARDAFQCYQKNSPIAFTQKLSKLTRTAAEGSDLDNCALRLFSLGQDYVAPHRNWINQNYDPHIKAAVENSRAYIRDMGRIEVK